MRLSFVSVISTDKLLLPALLYEPDRSAQKAALWLHGMGDSGAFYKPDLINALGEAFADKGIAFLALNNRGAHNVKTLKVTTDQPDDEDGRYLAGTNYELITDSIKDIDGGVQLLKKHGYSELYLIGHSTGANKICAYHAGATLNPFSKYVLAGPGDDTGIFFTELGEKGFWQALRYAAKEIGKNPLKIMPKYTRMYPFSVQSAYDILNPDGAYNTFPYYEAKTERLGKKPLFREYASLDRPTLVIFGENDEYAFTAGDANGALKLFMNHSSNTQLKHNDFEVVRDADHAFNGREKAFARQVSDWLGRE